MSQRPPERDELETFRPLSGRYPSLSGVALVVGRWSDARDSSGMFEVLDKPLLLRTI